MGIEDSTAMPICIPLQTKTAALNNYAMNENVFFNSTQYKDGVFCDD